MSLFTEAQTDAGDLAKLVNEDVEVTTRYGGQPKKSWLRLQGEFETIISNLQENGQAQVDQVIAALESGGSDQLNAFLSALNADGNSRLDVILDYIESNGEGAIDAFNAAGADAINSFNSSASTALIDFDNSSNSAISNFNTGGDVAIDFLKASQGFHDVGTFASGFTYEKFNDVGRDNDGNPWVYIGDESNYPVTVSAGTDPSAFPSLYAQRGYNDHNSLANRTDEDAHPSSSITNGDALTAQDTHDATKALLIAQGFSGNYGFFEKGFTYNESGDVAIDLDGNIWTYNGALPFVVNAGTVPSEPGYSKYITAKTFNLWYQDEQAMKEMIVSEDYVGVRVEISERSSNVGFGSGRWVISSGLTQNGLNIIQSTYNPLIQFKLEPIGFVSLESLGLNSSNCSDVLALANEIASELGLKIKTESKSTDLYLTETVSIKNSIDITGSIKLKDGVNLVLEPDGDGESVDFSSLSGFDVFSDTVTGFDSSLIGRSFIVESDAVLTERYNPPSNAPYTKNTAFTLLDSDGRISPSLDMSFSTSDNPTVTALNDDDSISVKIGRLYVEGESGSVYSSLIINRSNVDVEINSTKSEGSQNATSISLNKCANTKLRLNKASDTDYVGLGYAISVGLSVNTEIDGGLFSKARASIDGRHGSNVTVSNVVAGIVGSHWGNNMVFNNCDVEYYTYSGKDLTVNGGKVYGFYAISVRSDVYYCIGKLSLKDVEMGGDVIRVISESSAIPSDIWTEYRKSFDEITVTNINALSDSVAFVSMSNTPNLIMPKFIKFNGANCSKSVTLLSIGTGSKLTIENDNKYSFDNVNCEDSAVLVGKPSTPVSINLNIGDVGNLDFQCNAEAIGDFRFNDLTLVNCQRLGTGTKSGTIEINKCKIVDPVFFLEVDYKLINCEFDGAMGTNGLGLVKYQIGCVAKLGSTGYKVPLNYFVDTAEYESL